MKYYDKYNFKYSVSDKIPVNERMKLIMELCNGTVFMTYKNREIAYEFVYCGRECTLINADGNLIIEHNNNDINKYFPILTLNSYKRFVIIINYY